jgi:hypothetical protein
MVQIFLSNRSFFNPVIKSVASLLACATMLAAGSVELKRERYRIHINVDSRPFTTYYFDPAIAKPYLMPLRTSSGVIVTREFPIGNDVSAGNPKASAFEPHQRPLYFGHGDLDGLDFWQEQVFDKYYTDHGHQAYGHVVFRNIQSSQSRDSAYLRAEFTLNSPHDRVIGQETQEYTFRGDTTTRLIDCRFTLSATNGPLDIGDTKEGTFAIRLAPQLSAPYVHMTNSNGGIGEKEIWGKPADWVDYSGTIDGRHVDVVVFDSPQSFRHPTTWHARAYGLLAANPFGLREFTHDSQKDGSWTVPEGKSVVFCYRVLIHEGSLSPKQIAEAYRKYAATQSDK